MGQSPKHARRTPQPLPQRSGPLTRMAAPATLTLAGRAGQACFWVEGGLDTDEAKKGSSAEFVGRNRAPRANAYLPVSRTYRQGGGRWQGLGLAVDSPVSLSLWASGRLALVRQPRRNRDGYETRPCLP